MSKPRQADDHHVTSGGQMSTYEERVAEAAGIYEALIVLGIALDEINERLATLVTTPSAEPVDSWNAWGDPTIAHKRAVRDQLSTEVARDMFMGPRRGEEIAQVRALIEANSDANEHRALEARLRLLEDDGKPIEPAVDEGIRLNTDGELVNFPVASLERQITRRNWAEQSSLHTFQSEGGYLDEQQMIDAFVKGGPMWLYLYDRDAIMGMPDTWRRALVADVELDSPAEAQQFARDILKDLSADASRDTVIGALGS